MNLNHLMVETEDTFASLLEFAANNDVQGIERWIERDPCGVDEVGLWYGRRNGSKQMVLEHRTPLMVAANYGSIDVLKLILSLPEIDVNRCCGSDKSTALHCGASGGSVNCVDTVKLLLGAGADPNLVDANGNRAIDVIVESQNLQDMRLSLENLLRIDAVGEVLTPRSGSNSPPLSPSPGNQFASCSSGSVSSPKSDEKCNDPPASSMPERKEYPVDPSLPDIKNSIYSSDEFRMFSFKIRPCSRAYSHDWTECPFLHPGENARRRDPRKYHYSCVPCPEFRNKGACRRGDMCEYAHGVFESWLHPAQYRTRLCKDGTKCNRRVCFFAHTQDELRPLYVSSGSAVPSPTSNAIEFAAAMGLIPGSPSSPFTPPMSPSNNGIQNIGWPQQNVPALHLPGGSLQSSRLRASFHARDIPPEELNMLQISRSSISTSSFNRSESSSPRYCDQNLPKSCFSPTHKSAILNQFQLLSPINTNSPPKNADNPLLQTSFGVSSPGRMSPRVIDPVSPLPSHVSLLSHHEKQQQFRSLSFNSSAAVGSPVDSWPRWDFSSTKPSCVVNSEPFGNKLRRSSSFEQANNGEEPDLSWVQRLVKESPQETTKDKSANAIAIAGVSVEGSPSNSQIEHIDQSELSAWLEQVQLGQLLAQ
nr:zinc finger CCCH domain-containing protein 30-like [Ipomoea batatas]